MLKPSQLISSYIVDGSRVSSIEPITCPGSGHPRWCVALHLGDLQDPLSALKNFALWVGVSRLEKKTGSTS